MKLFRENTWVLKCLYHLDLLTKGEDWIFIYQKSSTISRLIKSATKSVCIIFHMFAVFFTKGVMPFICKKVLYLLQVVANRKGYFSICRKIPLNRGDSKSTIVVGVWKSRNWCAYLLLLEDCKRSLSGRLVQRSNNSENLTRGVRGLEYSCLKRGIRICYCAIYFIAFIFLQILSFI